MEGFEVISVNDDKCIGHVVGQVGDNLIVEHGTLRKTRNALPLAFAEVDEAQRRVVTTLAHELVYDSPKITDDEPDAEAIAMHYGLAAAYDEEPSRGYGDVDADELAGGAQDDFNRSGAGAPEAQRAEMRENIRPEGTRAADESPALLGDRYTEVPRRSDER